MESSIIDRIILEIYHESQNEIPNMGNITPARLGLEVDQFQAAILKLENELFITGVDVNRVNNRIYSMFLTRVKLTQRGIHYCENEITDVGKCEFKKPDYVKSSYKVFIDTLENYEKSDHSIKAIVKLDLDDGWRKVSEVKDDTNILITIKK